MSKIIFFILSVSMLFGASIRWRHTYRFELKKDQTAKILVSYRDKKVFLRDGVLTLRWTLYKNDELILFDSYQKVKHQHVLSLKRGLNSFVVELVPMDYLPSTRVYALVVFSDFDRKKEVADMEIYIRDDNNKILADFVDPNA